MAKYDITVGSTPSPDDAGKCGDWQSSFFLLYFHAHGMLFMLLLLLFEDLSEAPLKKNLCLC